MGLTPMRPQESGVILLGQQHMGISVELQTAGPGNEGKDRGKEKQKEKVRAGGASEGEGETKSEVFNLRGSA